MAASDVVSARAQQRLLTSMFKPEAEDEKYQILEVIGKGGFGEVNKVQCRISGQLKAMKRLPFDVTRLDNDILLREIQNILQIKPDKNILQWFDIFRTRNNQLAIVMELCDSDLEGYWSKNEVRGLKNGFRIAVQAAQGVVFLHTHNPQIIHRDLKPQNILIRKLGDEIVIKISDFGISSSSSSSSAVTTGEISNYATKEDIARLINVMKTTAGHGTWPFMAPELCAGRDGVGLVDGKLVYDASVDIFALGQVFNYIFCYNDSDYGAC